MYSIRFAAGLTAILWAALSASTAGANFHLWEIAEVFSNYDGSVQFIELHSASTGQQVVTGHQITASSNGVVVETFTFPSNTATPTTNKDLLIATPGFAALTGAVTPDYSFLETQVPFFDPNAESITINFIGADSVNFAGSLLPTDGVNSLVFTTSGIPSIAVNSPKNFAGAVGSVNVPPPPTATPTGDYNGDLVVDAADYTVWRNHFGEADETNINDAGDGMGGVDEADYNVWVQFYGNVLDPPGGGGSSSVPEPTVAALVFSGVLMSLFRRRR